MSFYSILQNRIQVRNKNAKDEAEDEAVQGAEVEAEEVTNRIGWIQLENADCRDYCHNHWAEKKDVGPILPVVIYLKKKQ